MPRAHSSSDSSPERDEATWTRAVTTDRVTPSANEPAASTGLAAQESHPDPRQHRPSMFGVQFRWSSLEHFLNAVDLRDGVHAFPLPGAEHAVYEFYVRLRPGAPLLAHFHGATPRKPNDLPKITGLPISGDLPATLVIPSDPILDLDDAIRIGWHVGQRGVDVHAVAVSVLQHVAEVAASPRIVAWGGSGGGYAAIRIARDITGCVAFVWNPQTSIDAYSAPSVQAFRAVGRHEQTVLAGRPESDLTHPGAWADFRGEVVCFQEESDWHVESHLLPTLRAVGCDLDAEALVEGVLTRVSANLSVAISHWGDGHAPPPRPIIARMLHELTKSGDVDPWAALESSRPLLLAARALRQPVRPFTLHPADALASSPSDDDAARQLAQGLLNLRALRQEESDDVLSAATALEPLLEVAGRTEELAALRGPRAELAGLALLHLARQLEPTSHARPVRAAAERLLAHASLHRGGAPEVTEHIHESVEESELGTGVFVYGSCVSRDAFELDGAPQLAGYVTRSTVASAFSAPPDEVPGLDLSANPSAFQRRMVDTDVRKLLAEHLRAHASGPVLLDFIDERLDARMVGGTVITQSPELLRCSPPAPIELLVQSGSPAHRMAFRNGFRRLVTLVDPERIIVNRVYWSELDHRGRRVADAGLAARSNALLDELYRAAEEAGVTRFLSYDPDLLVADADHKWGRGPFHFVPALYESQLEQLRRLGEERA